MRVAFDVDDTLYKLVEDTAPRKFVGVGANCSCGTQLKQEVDPLMVALAHSLITDGHEVFLWSAGGEDYVLDFIRRFCPAWESVVSVLPKEKGHDIDICFDDQDVDLARINLRIKREHADHHD